MLVICLTKKQFKMNKNSVMMKKKIKKNLKVIQIILLAVKIIDFNKIFRKLLICIKF